MTDNNIKQQFVRWTETHAKAAQKQGWDMFDYDCRGLLQIQKSDEAEIFASDAEAAEFVGVQAESGDETARLAIELNSFFDRHIYPGDYETETVTETAITLPATVQPQLWVNDHAVDTGSPIHFDAQSAMLGLPARLFARYADEILNERGHDYDDLAINSGVVDDWLQDNKEATFLVTVDRQDFYEWLDTVGVAGLEAVRMTEERLQELRDRVSNGIEAPSFSR